MFEVSVFRYRWRRCIGVILGAAAWGLWGYPAGAFNPAAGDLQKADPSNIRVLQYNVEGKFIKNAASDAVFQRIITAVRPDIISFNEIDDSTSNTTAHTAQAIANRLQSYFPGETWSVNVGISDSFNQNALASRYPLSMKITDTDPPSDIRGVTAALVDLPNAVYGSTDFYVMSVHFKSGGTLDDCRRRQIYADALTNWMRDARTVGCTTCPAGDRINLPPGTPILIVGDVNLSYLGGGDYEPYHPERTLTTGEIYDTATFGPSSPPDWDGTDSTDAAPFDHNTANANTDRSDEVQPRSRFDQFHYTDSVMHVANRFVLNTLTMSPSAIAAAGLQPGDTVVSATGASDHLPVVVDFALGPDTAPPGRMVINEFNYDDPGADTYSFVELKNVGGQAVNLQAPIDYHLKTSSNNLPVTAPSTPNQSRNFDLQGIVPPGGIFVVYNSTGESLDVATSITAALPKLQREDLADFSQTFTLPDGPNTGLALVTVEPYIDTAGSDSTNDTLVEAYLYENTAAGSTHYFRTNSTNQLLIALGPAESSTVALSSTSQSYSRDVGDTAWNSFAGWAIPDRMTPGLENATLLNMAPVLAVDAPLVVGRGETAVIDAAHLQVTDAESTPAEVTFTVAVFPLQGTLMLGSTALSSGGVSTFTQADVDAGIVKYVHGGVGTIPDSFTFTVSDSQGGSIGATTFSITVVAPTAVGDWILLY